MRTLMKFEADWCGPCQQVKPIVDQVMGDHTDLALEVVDIDQDANLPLVQQYGVRAVPTFVLRDGDQVLATATGAMTRSQLEEFVAR